VTRLNLYLILEPVFDLAITAFTSGK
jgi:hypothetical protein